MARLSVAEAVEILADMEPHAGKVCGSCTACCHVVPVREVGTQAWQRCPHVRSPPDAAIGCSIYPTRPRSCRFWICGWLGADWPDELRPDRCGVIVDPAEDLIRINGEEKVAARLWVMPGHEEDWESGPVRDLIEALTAAGFVVLWDMSPNATNERLSRVFLKDEAGRLGITQPAPPSPLAMPEEQRWLRARELNRK